MKLTKYLRDAFVEAAMADVPVVDYAGQRDKLFTDALVAKLPPKVRAVWDDPALRGYLSHEHPWEHDIGVALPGGRSFEPDAKLKAELAELQSQHRKQRDHLKDLRNKLFAAANGCTTRKALAELLPEFEKYLPPAGESTCRTLPAVANLMADFVAAGWPKDKPKKVVKLAAAQIGQEKP